jgi:Tol biopolymer transport system component
MAGSALALVVAGAFGAHWLAARSAPRHATILDLALPTGVELGEYPSASLSKDGRQFVCVAADRNGNALWLRPLSSATSTKLPGTEGAAMPQSPIWSPDGRYLLFATEGGRIKKLELGNGMIETFWSDSSGQAWTGGPRFVGDWNGRGDILFSWRRALYKMRAAGGRPEQIATPGKDWDVFAGNWLPDDRHYLLFAAEETGANGVYVGALGSSERTRVLASDLPASYTEPGYLVFTQAGALCAQRFDATRRKVLGNPVRLVQGVEAPPWGGQNQWASQSNLVFSHVTRQRSQLTWLDARGREVGRVGDALDILTFDLSKDDARVAASIGSYSSGSRLGLLDAARQSTPVWLTDGPGEFDARFDRGGNDLLFTGTNDRGQGVFRMSIRDRSWKPVRVQTREELARTGDLIITHDWSADGRFVVYSRVSGGVEVGSAAGDTSHAQVIPAPGRPDQARFSPDGRWIAFHAFESDVSARLEQCQVFVSAYPPRGEPQRISAHGGVQPLWRADGRVLYYLDPEGNLMAVSVTPTAQALTVGPPRLLFSTGLKKVSWQVEDYAVSRDGQRFLVKLPVEGEAQSGFTIVMNWPALLSGAK